MFKLIIIFITLLISASCTSSKVNMPHLPVSKDNTEVKITTEILVGSWDLIEFKITKPNGETHSWGPKPNGLLIYDRTGHMSVSINSGANLPTSKAHLEKNILFYAGTYKLSGNEIIHHVKNASNPDRIRTILIRQAKLMNSSRLRLMAKKQRDEIIIDKAVLIKSFHLQLTAKGEYGDADLLWEKIPAS